MTLQKKEIKVNQSIYQYSSKVIVSGIINFDAQYLPFGLEFSPPRLKEIHVPNGRVFRVPCQSILIIHVNDTKTDCVTIAPFKIVQ